MLRHPSFAARLLRLAAAFLLAPLVSLAATWRPLEGNPARYETTLSGWTLTVDAPRARLVSAVPPGGAPEDNILLRGGHRVWLGPQSEWPAFWPPPRDWESSPAASVALSADATELTLALPRADPAYPPLVRRYRLLPDALLLVAAWQPDPAPVDAAPGSFQVVQILQTRPDTQVWLSPRPGPAVPLGHGLLALSNRPGTDLASPIPAALATPATESCVAPGTLRLVGTGQEEKVGVPPQPLVARFAGGHGLRLLPVTHDGVEDTGRPAPEAGLYTQAYFGATKWAMTELEQLSPRLHPARADGVVEVTLRLEFLPPPPQTGG